MIWLKHRRVVFFLGRYTRYSRQLILTRADGFVCISEELARRYRDNHVPIVTIGNGFDLREVEPREPAANARPKAIFVGSDGQVWHGVDKLVDLADRLPNFEFHVVGIRMTEARPNVIAHGVLDWAQLHTLYSQMDVGIGTLALHRNGMSEASPLKTREYLAHGLPVIGAYSDTDLNGCSFYLRLENSEGGVAASVASIEAFVAKWRGVPLDRHRVEALIGAVGKEKRRLEFFRVIVNGKKLAKEGAAVFRDGKDRPSKR
ncbi:glycosyltransferase [Candidatus Accumulibacter phosphatis]|uniref:Glycosyltransferase n=1 Tax=Candidatus Accumulibacter phosphatis TaxID=327160 RepID=A0ABX1U3P7_9PROT|nr:glycosyltransferase [Candidatus Accumulibacter phosphatis]NMQ29812.1 glycosyltransferase [Candidatus Accumulibacter phosphatis]